MKHRIRLPAATPVVVALALATAACGPAMEFETTPPPTGVQPAPAGFTEPMAADWLAAVTRAEVELAELALQRATSPEVRTYAQSIIDQNRAFQQRYDAWHARAGIHPTPGPTAADFDRARAQALERLRAYEGPAFDRAFLQYQLETQRWQRRTLDDAILPAIHNRALRTMLMERQPEWETRLLETERIHGGLPTTHH
jgi:putative membrane protein